MKALLQRVNKASVTINEKETRSIGKGLCIFLGITAGDDDRDIKYIVRKLKTVRYFADDSDKFRLTIADVDGEILLISQFTLYGTLRKGTKPEFSKAMQPDSAKELYQLFIKQLKLEGFRLHTGEFGQYMKVAIENDGPVTFMLSSDHLKHHAV